MCSLEIQTAVRALAAGAPGQQGGGGDVSQLHTSLEGLGLGGQDAAMEHRPPS